MPLTVFEHALFLQSLGWAIAHSFWQSGLLWLAYKLIITANKKLPAVYKHNLALVLLGASFLWFNITLLHHYFSLEKTLPTAAVILNDTWQIEWKQLNQALPYLSVGYLVLFCFYAVRFFRNYTATSFFQNNGLLKAPADLRIFTNSTALHLGIKKKVRVWLSQHVDVPSVIGFLKPVILLPAAAVNHLTPQQLEAILLHELVHIKRNDFLVNLLQSMVELVLFFNPFALMLSNTIKKEREHCCDDWVLNFRYDNYDYAKALLLLEEQRTSQVALQVTATNGKKKLLNRIKRLFSTVPSVAINRGQKLQLLAVGMLVVTGIVMVLPSLSGVNENSNSLSIIENSPMIPLNMAMPDNSNNESQENNVAIINNLAAISAGNKKVITEPIVQKTIKKITRHTIKNTCPKEVAEQDEVTIALINDELINNKVNPSIEVIPVADAEPVCSPEIFVKIEEEQSGQAQQNTYYFQLKDSSGIKQVKPLMLLKKLLKEKAVEKAKLKTVSKVKVRITS